MQNTAVYSPITFEEIVMVMIKDVFAADVSNLRIITGRYEQISYCSSQYFVPICIIMISNSLITN